MLVNVVKASVIVPKVAASNEGPFVRSLPFYLFLEVKKIMMGAQKYLPSVDAIKLFSVVSNASTKLNNIVFLFHVFSALSYMRLVVSYHKVLH